ncbi:hypothetical protein [Lacinutrix sp. Hel_I_90]|uniref:hypothetical protein n=1 Tax=Lacinutrix sp. Hel_I_90 TaxID=1249999 RepID=UPI0005C9E34C|nr:hypothetical protein [Lacinutrix sp. Hel_I_90]
MNKQLKDSIIDNTVTVLSAVGGGKLSNGVVGLIPVEDKMGKVAVKGVIALSSIAGAAYIKGKSVTKSAARGALLGMAWKQIDTLTDDLVKDNNIIDPITEGSSTAEKFIANVFGMGCPAQTQSPRYVQMPSLNMPFMTAPDRAKNLGVTQLQTVSAESFN